MLPDRVSNPGPLTYESGALLIALRGPAANYIKGNQSKDERVRTTTIFSSKSNLDLCPKMLKHKLIQDFATLNIYMKLNQNMSINESI